jgi:hypothetical protein
MASPSNGGEPDLVLVSISLSLRRSLSPSPPDPSERGGGWPNLVEAGQTWWGLDGLGNGSPRSWSGSRSWS